MKRVKISIVIMLLLITLSLTILSGCSVNLEKINEKNAEAIEFGFYTETIEDHLKRFEDDSEWFKEYSESLVGYDYNINFHASQAIRAKYSYILSATKFRIDIQENGSAIEKNKIYVFPHKIEYEYVQLKSIDRDKTSFVAFAFITEEQFSDITDEKIAVGGAWVYKEEVWNKLLQVSDKVVEWNL